jgi:hypothetical protein
MNYLFYTSKALDLLLSTLDENGPLEKESYSLQLFAFNSSQYQQIASPIMQESVVDASVDEYLTNHMNQVNKIKKKTAKSWLNPLKELINIDTFLSDKVN